jgi:hypothetical protein
MAQRRGILQTKTMKIVQMNIGPKKHPFLVTALLFPEISNAASNFVTFRLLSELRKNTDWDILRIQCRGEYLGVIERKKQEGGYNYTVNNFINQEIFLGGWDEYLARMAVKVINAHKILVGETEGKTPFGIRSYRWDDNIKMNLYKIRYMCVDLYLIQLTQNRAQSRALVNTVINFV